MRTFSERLPLSAPGPPARARVASGLWQPAPKNPSTTRTNSAGFMSHRFSRKDDDHAKNKTAEQHQRGAGGDVQMAKPVPAPTERQRKEHP